MPVPIWIDGIETLDDIIAEGLDVLFVGYNPNLYAVEQRHYYARRANRFWEDLHEAGLVPRVLRGPGEDVEILAHGLGLTDAVKRPSPNIDALTPEDFRIGFARLDALIARYGPRIVCFNGVGLLERYRRRTVAPLAGRLAITSPGVLVRAVPSTSPRNNAPAFRERRLSAFRELRALVESVRDHRFR